MRNIKWRVDQGGELTSNRCQALRFIELKCGSHFTTSHDLSKMANEENRDDSEEKFNANTDSALTGLSDANNASEIESMVQAASEGKVECTKTGAFNDLQKFGTKSFRHLDYSALDVPAPRRFGIKHLNSPRRFGTHQTYKLSWTQYTLD